MLKLYFRSGALYDDIFCFNPNPFLIVCTCRDGLIAVGGSAVGGKICCLKPVIPVNLHRGNPQSI